MYPWLPLCQDYVDKVSTRNGTSLYDGLVSAAKVLVKFHQKFPQCRKYGLFCAFERHVYFSPWGMQALTWCHSFFFSSGLETWKMEWRWSHLDEKWREKVVRKQKVQWFIPKFLLRRVARDSMAYDRLLSFSLSPLWSISLDHRNWKHTLHKKENRCDPPTPPPTIPFSHYLSLALSLTHNPGTYYRRILALTDGEDISSRIKPDKAAASLQVRKLHNVSDLGCPP